MPMTYVKNNLLPAVIWGASHLFFLHWQVNAFGELLALRGFLVFVFLLLRFEPTKRGPLYQAAVAWFSTWLPTQLAWRTHGVTSDDLGLILIVVGSLVVALSIVDLGRSFGISPAVRPQVAGGIYKYVRNPMYWGHFVGELGILAVARTTKNGIIILIGWSLYVLRARWERGLVSGKSEVLDLSLALGRINAQKRPAADARIGSLSQ